MLSQHESCAAAVSGLSSAGGGSSHSDGRFHIVLRFAGSQPVATKAHMIHSARFLSTKFHFGCLNLTLRSLHHHSVSCLLKVNLN